MPALVTGPNPSLMALGISEIGREIEGAIAGVILGGLTTSMLLNLA